MDVRTALDPGALVVQQPCNGSTSQQWILLTVPGSIPGTKASFVENLNSTLFLDAKGASLSPGTPGIQWSPNYNANQQWIFQSVPDGSYVIKNVNSSLSLDLAGDPMAQ